MLTIDPWKTKNGGQFNLQGGLGRVAKLATLP